jgi:outer membrane protein assembly factor BamB
LLELDAQLPGFRSRRIEVDVAAAGMVDVVLERMPSAVVAFGAPAQTGVGLADGWLAVGLRGGKLGIAHADGSQLRQVALGGLRTVEAAPLVVDGFAVFLTNENTIECFTLATGVAAPGWPVTLAASAATDLAVRSGRVAAVDRDGVLRVYELATGRQAVALPLEGAPSGPPVFDGRHVVVGTTDGRILVADALDGSLTAQLRAPAGVVTRVLADRGALYAGLADGSVAGFDAAAGSLLWTAAAGRTLADGEITVAKGAVVVAGANRRLLAIDRATGAVAAELQLPGDVRAGLRTDGDTVHVAVRVPKTRTTPVRDVLLAVDAATMTVAWEHCEPDFRVGGAAVDGAVVAVPHAGGGVAVIGGAEARR